ncbi:hypothetical protein ES705_23781 [subsurface metagenome]
MEQGKKEFLEVLFKGIKGYIDIRTFKIGATGKFEKVDYFFHRIKDINELIRLLKKKHFENLNIHFGVAPRYRQSGTEKDVKILRCFWCDLDCKRKNKPDLPTKKEALELIKKFKLAPSIIVDSGQGYHLYWLLSESINIKNENAVLKLRGVLAGLSQSLGGDVAGKDLSRCLRIPETLNLKPENPKGLPVKIIKFDKSITYNIKEFKPFYVEQKETVLGEVDLKKEEIGGWIRDPESLELPKNFYKLLDSNKKLRETFSGNRTDLNDQTKSGYSMSLASLLVHHQIFTDEQIIKAMILQPRAKERKKTPQNLMSTLKKAKGSYASRSEKKEKKEKKIRTKTLIPGLIHLIREGEKVSYLLQNNEKFYTEETRLEEGGITCRPKQELPYYHCEPDILEMDRNIDFVKLLTDIENYIRDYLELPDKKDYFVLALWVFHTYLMEKFNTTPFSYFHGVYGSGKSRAGEVLMELSFRGWTMTSPTEASLFRPIQYYEPTIHLDHVRFYGSETNQAVKLLLQSRYKRGLKVIRIDVKEKGEEGTNFYNVFGATIISTEDTITGALKSRSITFMMKENINKKVEKDFDKEKAKNIRDRLIIFRANYINKDLAEVYPSVARRRLAEILNPLSQILMTIAPERKGEFEQVVKRLQGEEKDEIGFSIGAEIVDCLVNYYNDTEELYILSGILTDRINEGKPDIEKYKVNYISRECYKLTFRRRLSAKHKARSGFLINFELLKELSQKYNTTKLKIKSVREQVDLIFSDSKNETT